MAKYNDLTKEQKKLYNRLKTFVDRNDTFNFAIGYYKKEDLIEVFTIKNEVRLDGKELTLLEYADYTKKPSSAQTIREMMKSLRLPIDQHTSHSTQNKQQPLQSNLQDTNPASVPAETDPAQVAAENAQQVQDGQPSAEEELFPISPTLQDNDNFTEDQQKLYDNLKSVIKGNDIVKLSSLLQNLSKEDLRRMLTIKQKVKFEGGITESLTLFGCAMNFYDGDKKIKVILEHFSQYPILLKEMLTAIQKVTFSNGIEYTFTPLNYASTFNDDGKRIEVILQSIKDKTLLKEILTATHKIKLSDGNIGTLTPLGHAMLRNGGKKKIGAILQSVDDQDLLEEILTAKQIINGKEYILLQYVDYYAPECASIIRRKMDEVEHTSQPTYLDQHTSQLPFFDQHKGKVALVARLFL